METYLHIIQAILSDWVLITLNNPVYAAVLAIAVFLLTAIIYSIKIGSLKEMNIASENARLEMENTLDAVKQKMQHMQEELAANTDQMEQAKQFAQNEAQRAAGLEEQLSQRNQQIAGIIQSLHTRFDLGERPLPVMDDIKAEDLWQQHDRVINLITTRLQSEQQARAGLQQSYQAETAKRAEKEALLETMQTTLATQTIQVSKLEQALEEQKALLQEEKDKAQQVLSQTLEKHLAELARITELEQQTLDLVNTRQQLTQLEVKLNAKEALITQLEKDTSVEPVKAEAQPAFIKQEEIEPIVELKESVDVAPPAPPVIEQAPVSPFKEQKGGVAGKLKGMFGKTKQEPVIAEPEPVETRHYEEEITPAPVEIEQQPVISVKEQTGGVAGKLKGMFGKTKEEPITKEPESVETRQYEEKIQPAPVTIEQASVSPLKDKYGRIKHYFGDAKPQAEVTAETRPAALHDEQPSASPDKGQLGKLKNLFGSKQKTEESDEEAAQPAPVDVEQASVSPAKGQFGKFKNLFGKTK